MGRVLPPPRPVPTLPPKSRGSAELLPRELAGSPCRQPMGDAFALQRQGTGKAIKPKL